MSLNGGGLDKLGCHRDHKRDATAVSEAMVELVLARTLRCEAQ
jgi:hypothetical protein